MRAEDHERTSFKAILDMLDPDLECDFKRTSFYHNEYRVRQTSSLPCLVAKSKKLSANKSGRESQSGEKRPLPPSTSTFITLCDVSADNYM